MTDAAPQAAKQNWRDWLNDQTPTTRAQARLGEVYRAALIFLRNPLAAIGLAIVIALILIAATAPWIAPHSPFDQDLTRRLLPPGGGFLLGTDDLGRDILSRILHGARITLYIVFVVAITAGPIGLLVGAIAGYFGGLAEAILMRVTDIFLAFPKLILALAFVAALGAGLNSAIIAIAITSWPPIARIARAEALTIRNAEHVAATRLLGASHGRIIAFHVMPLCAPSVIVRITLDMAGIIMIAAGLGFLGLGAQPPAPEWGAMVSGGRAFLIDQWWIATLPGAAIFIVSLGFNLLGDGLRDALDPKRAAS
jgi:peptide/nickel transport system permease protein